MAKSLFVKAEELQELLGMPSLGMMTVNSLVAADSVIIPSQPNFLSTKGLNLLMHSISKVTVIPERLQLNGDLRTPPTPIKWRT